MKERVLPALIEASEIGSTAGGTFTAMLGLSPDGAPATVPGAALNVAAATVPVAVINEPATTLGGAGIVNAKRFVVSVPTPEMLYVPVVLSESRPEPSNIVVK